MAYFATTAQAQPARSRENYPYRFGGVRAKHGRGRAALNGVNGYLKSLINRIADAKLRRMQRELALRGIHFDAAAQGWVTRTGRR